MAAKKKTVAKKAPAKKVAAAAPVKKLTALKEKFTKKEVLEFKIKDNSIVFDALDDQGFELPHGCLAGSCGACRIEITAGTDNLSPCAPIEQDTIDAIKLNYERIHGEGSSKDLNIRLACRAKVKGDIEISPFN